MRFPRWAVPVLLRLLSMSGLTSATGETTALSVGFALSAAKNPTSATPSSQPRDSDPLNNLSLDLNFFVHFADQEFKVPIMPLHLLPKKSWNVYNTANISRVRADEAAARALEEAEEQRQQEQDAARRMAILRGETVPPLAIEDVPSPSDDPSRDHSSGRKRDRGSTEDEYSKRIKKPRRKYGEDETDFEMRVASQHASSKDEGKQLVLHKDSSNAPITDGQGHISLFPPSSKSSIEKVQKNPEVEAEEARKKKEYEDQYTMRFSNAAGFKNDIGRKAWYEDGKSIGPEAERDEAVVGKDVWGNEDPRRKEREAKRVVDNDPLAFMKRGAAQVRQVEKERKQWKVEKEREIRELEDAERRRRKRRRRERNLEDRSEDELEGFRLDPDSEDDREREARRERRRERDRSEDRRHRRKDHRKSGHYHDHRERSRERSKRKDEDSSRAHKHRRRTE